MNLLLLNELNNLIRKMLLKGLIFHSNVEALNSMLYQEEAHTLWVPNFRSIRTNFSQYSLVDSEPNELPTISGTCREIAIRMQAYLQATYVDQLEADLLGCAENKACYAVMLTIGQERFFMGAGLPQPVEELIPITGEPIISTLYVGEKQRGQLYSGAIHYQAISMGLEGVLFTILANGRIVSQYAFEPMSEKLDKDIIQLWLTLAGASVYSTNVIEGRFRIENSSHLVLSSQLSIFQRLREDPGGLTIQYYGEK